jgi:hypothetical protein
VVQASSGVLAALPLVSALLLSACVEVAPADPVPPDPSPDACGASSLQDVVGKDESILAATTFVAPMRVLRPGMAVTMDFSPERLNVEVDARGKIVRVFCG